MRVLIVEDERLILKSLSKLISKKGHHVDSTESGNEAIELIKTNEYDRIICDLMLNDISGFDILEYSKVHFTSDEIAKKFKLITAYSSQKVIENAKKYNCSLLNKPFNNIQAAITELLGEK